MREALHYIPLDLIRPDSVPVIVLLGGVDGAGEKRYAHVKIRETPCERAEANLKE